MTNFISPPNYSSSMTIRETVIAVRKLKECFANSLSEHLNLSYVSAPLFVYADSGINDTLNGVERPVSFGIKEQNNRQAQIVQSLAKWKRLALKNYGFNTGEGLYTDMWAVRRDEITDNIHSILVDQWDWEKVITYEDRNMDTLDYTVNKIYEAIKEAENYVKEQHPHIPLILPEKVTFVTSQELEELYPEVSSKTREYLFAKEKGAIFIKQIGGTKHENRAPDYDDWNLNGDLIFYYPLLDIAMEISSMGIRVDKASLLEQLKLCGRETCVNLEFHKALLDDQLPYTIGGGIGQSRLCMFLLQKAHIGEIQPSIWPDIAYSLADSHNISFL